MSGQTRGWTGKLPLVASRSLTRYVDSDEVYYLEAEGDDTLVRTRRSRRYRSLEPLGELEQRLPSPPFFRCHQSFVVNLQHVLELRSRGERDHELKLAPPVNKVIPVARSRLAAFRRAIERQRQVTDDGCGCDPG